ncbi:MAG: leucine-rich repeat protein [Marinilabiliaceae bacterium]|nr:leucine-rich repeat protein [Marinilabiliaceae bacterium]
MRHRNLFLALAFFGLSALANAQLVDSGTCGNGVTWEITGTSPNFTLTIGYDGVGTGVMTNYAAATDAPWDTYRADITTLVIENGITDIGDFTMPDMPNVTNPLTLPATLTRIGQYAFTASGFTGNLIIPEGVTSIEMGAFRLCTGLDGTLTIPASVTSIGERAFRGCTNITEVINNRFEPQTIDANVFQEVSLNNLTLNVLCEDLYGDAPVWQDFGTITGGNDASCPTAPFMSGNCGNGVNWEITGTMPNFTLHIIYDGVGTGVMNNYLIGTTPWYGQRANLKTLVIDNGVTVIANTAFADCWNLSGNLTIPNSVTSIGDYAFFGCGNFTGTLIIPNSVTTIGEDAFRNCTGFTGDLTIPNLVTSIGANAFTDCSGFTGTLTIPNLVTTIEAMTFSFCSGFTELIIGNSVTSIGTWAFTNCSGLQRIISLAISPSTVGTGYYNSFQNVPSTIPVNVPCVSVSNYQTDWSYFSNILCNNYNLNVLSNDNSLGVVSIDGLVYYYNTLYATSKPVGIFTGWSDGNTDNPRTVILSSDSTFTAIFIPNNTDSLLQKITELENDTASCNQNTLALLAQIANLENDTAACNQHTLALQEQINNLEADTMLLKNTIAELQSDTFLLKIIIKDLQASLDSCLNGLLTTKSIHLDEYSLRVYPNPTTGLLYVSTVGTRHATSVQIYDVVGVNVGAYNIHPEDDEGVIDISHLASGLYFLKIDGKTVKIVKQ